ncbi:MAG: hypothetical protein DRQ64_04580 [Gammaproteobacteria bacterium]|nr:MAG: hypothetical protein DRQ64_04580 [Gammaproteobacteria bacterium]
MSVKINIRQTSLATLLLIFACTQTHAGFFDDIANKTKNIAKQAVDKTIDELAESKPSNPPQAPLKPKPKPKYEHQMVADVQQQLNRLGYDIGMVDGLYGKGTRRAIERFQTDQNLVVNGTPTKLLLSRMEGVSPAVTRALANTSHDNVAQTPKQKHVVSEPASTEPVVKKSTASSKPKSVATATMSTPSVTSSQSDNNLDKKQGLPQNPAGAEETLTDLYSTLVRLRPDLLDKPFGSRKNSTLLDVILLDKPERYGLSFKSVQEFINNEFTHNQRHAEYKSLVLSAAVDAPLMYRKKINTGLSQYDFDAQTYDIRILEVATIYDAPFVRLFEGLKEIKGLKMSPNEGERLNKWYKEGGRNGHETIIGFWNYKIKSLKHTSELNSPSWISGQFIAEVEPLELIFYGVRSLKSPADVQKQKSQLDPLAAWKQAAAASQVGGNDTLENQEFKHVATFSLKDISERSSLNSTPLPPFDLVGVKFGDSPESVIAAIKLHNTDLVMKKEMASLNIPESLTYVHTLSNGGNRANSLDQFKVWFAKPPFNNTVIGIHRTLRLKGEKAAPLKAVKASLENKYGKPTKSPKGRPSSNNTYSSHQYVWLDEGSAGKLSVQLTVRDNAFVEEMTFTAGLSVNQHDITRKFERNQQLWQSYHKKASTQKIDGNVQAENVPAF